MDKYNLDIMFSDKIKESISGDNERDHPVCDDILLELLKELGFNKTVDEYNKVSANFWYA